LVSLQFSGQFPSGNIILASCDSKYFNEFGIPLAYSCNEAGNNLHLHVMDPEPMDYATASLVNSDLDIELTMSSETGGPKTREYYSCNRFIVAPHFIRNGVNKLLIIDTDCLVMKHLEFPDAKLGLFLRDPIPGTVGWENEGTHVAAGIVYYTRESLTFADEVSTTLRNNKLVWFIDQVALWRAYQVLSSRHGTMFADPLYEECHVFGSNDMDWEFIDGTNIWTGKGPRKYTNETYCNKQSYYMDMFLGIDKRFWIK